jgi:glycosyltransferase involved in cell wall biosynthesis
MSTSSRVGFITTSFPRYRGDPSGSFVHGLAAAMVARGHRVEVVVPQPDGPDDWKGDASWLRGVRVFSAAYVRPRRFQRLFFNAGAPDNLFDMPRLWGLVPPAMAGLYLAALRRSRRWDGVISHWLVPSALIAGGLPLGKKRHLATGHSGDVHMIRRSPLKNLLARAVIRSADRVGFVSEQLRSEFENALGPRLAAQNSERLVVTPMGVDPECFQSRRERGVAREELGLDRFTVLFLGRLVPIKGADLLIEALAGRREMQIVVAGDGPQRERLERAASVRGVNAQFLGEVDQETRADLFAACDVLAVPSRELGDGRHEGIPLVVIEAMAAGLPVVAADTGAIGEIVKDGETGLLAPSHEQSALCDAISKIAADEVLRQRLKSAGRAAVCDRSWETRVGLFEELLFNP